MKLHEIIQDLSNMILIYEKFFFKDMTKPKNNQELFCYLIVQYINEKIKKIKFNAFMKLFVFKEIQPKVRYIRKNNTNFKETKCSKKVSGLSEKINSKKIGIFNTRYKINNTDE